MPRKNCIDPETKLNLHYNAIREKAPIDPKYKVALPTFDMMDRNWEVLKRIDESQREKKELLWRKFYIGVADGRAFYQIVKVNKKTCVLEWCKDLTEYAEDEFLGRDESVVSLQWAEQKVMQMDLLDQLFS